MLGIVLGGFAFAEDAYIESLSTSQSSGQAISTGYCPGPTTRVEVDCEPQNLTTLQQRPFGVRNGNVAFEIYVNNSMNYAYNCHGSTPGNVSTGVPYRGGRQTMVLDAANKQMKVILADGTVVVDAVIAAKTLTERSDYPLALFADFSASSPNDKNQFVNFGAYKVYGLKIFENGELMHDFRPLLKGDRPGFRDIKTGRTIWQSNAYFPLAYGGDIATEKDDAYIASDGNSDKSQVVNLRHRFTPTTKVEVDFALTATNRAQDRIFGASESGTAENPFANVSALYLDGGHQFSMSAGFPYAGSNTAYPWLAQSTGLDADMVRHTAVVDRPGNKLSFITAGVTNWSAAISDKAVCTADECAYPLGLFANMTSATGASSSQQSAVRVYGVRIWKMRTLIHDYRPCVKGDVPGFRDVVDGAFVTSENVAGHAVGGAVERIPDDPYVELTGNNGGAKGDLGNKYIQLDRPVTPTTRFELDYSFAENVSSGSNFAMADYRDKDAVSEVQRCYLMCNVNGFSYRGGTADWGTITADAKSSKAKGIRRWVAYDVPNRTIVLRTAGYTNVVLNNVNAPTVEFANNIRLGSNFDPSGFAPLRIYGCKIFENGQLVSDFRPCVTNANAGLRNVLTGGFHADAWSNSLTNRLLTAGGASVCDDEASKGAYIEFDGTQNIDSLYKPNGKSRIEADLQLTATAPAQMRVWANPDGANLIAQLYVNGSCAWALNYDARALWKGTGLSVSLERVRLIVDAVQKQLRIVTNGETVTNNCDWVFKTYMTDFDHQSSGSLLIGGSTSNPLAPMRLYGFRIYEGGSLKRDFIPYKSGGVIGLYDKVDGGIYEKARGNPLKIGGTSATLAVAPTDTTIDVQKSATLTAVAAGAVSYKWYLNGEEIPDETGTALKVDWRKGKPHEDVISVRPVYTLFGETVIGDESSATVTHTTLGLAVFIR